MNCEIISNSILQYLDNELTKEQLSEFDEHLQKCSGCKQLFNEVAATYQLIEVEKNLPVKPFFYHKLTTRLKSDKQEKANSRFMNVLKPLAVAASIALGIMIGNGEVDVLSYQENDFDLASESIGLVMPADYSVWTTINEDDGSEN